MNNKTQLKLAALLRKPWFGSAVYLLLGLSWIAVSDVLLAWLITDAVLLTQYQSYKGYLYVCLTAVLAWLLLNQRQQAAQSLSVAEQAQLYTFAYAGVGIAHISLQGKFLRTNRALQKMLGYTDNELSQLNLQQLTHPSDLDNDVKALQQLLAKTINSYELEKRYQCKDGAVVWARISVTLLQSDAPAYFITVIHDISEQKLAQQQ